MMNNMTIKKLHGMKLSGMADAYESQLNNKNAGALSFEDRFGIIVDTQWNQRQSNHITRLIKNAALRCPMAAIEDIDYKPERNLDKTLMDKLSCCGYLQDNQNITIMGPTGSGKTYIACALANSACRNHYSAKYVRLPDLLIELAIVKNTENHRKLINSYKKIRLLVIDEWLLTPLVKNEAYDLLELVEARYDVGSTVFCSQYGPESWHKHIGIDVIADAVLDRIVHNSIQIELKGESMRKKKFSKNKGV
jgi:DNA replication protein DnaC